MPFQTSPFFGEKNTALGEDTVDGIDGKLLELRGRRVNTMLNEVILSVTGDTMVTCQAVSSCMPTALLGAMRAWNCFNAFFWRDFGGQT